MNFMRYCIMRYCIMRPYTEGRLDRYRIDIPRELSKIRTQPWLICTEFIISCNLCRSLILSDPGTYFRQLTIREEGLLKPPPPYDLENYCINFHHIIHVHFTRCFRHVPIGIFPKFAIFTFSQRIQNKK